MGENWSLSQEEEDLHLQSLFRKARKGDEKATQERPRIQPTPSMPGIFTNSSGYRREAGRD